jgi:CO/xanthine dehydrogenase Mo-binding subunit
MNALARALNMDPMEIRLRNAHRIGTTISTGQVLKESVGFTDTLVQAVEKFRSLAQASKTKEAPHQ